MDEATRVAALSGAYEIVDRLRAEIGKVVSGKAKEIALLVCAAVAGGHVLIEDVPGVGKTTLATALSRAAGLGFRRAQFTPDVMASDITGFNVYNRKTENFDFRPGLVNTNILLADEINRASPKTQSSLLEAMEEMRVTVDGVTYRIPQPFLVIATQNPSGFVGTFPLPEAQLDRFAIRLSMGYPSQQEELSILRGRRGGDPMEGIKAVANAEILMACRRAAETVYVSPSAEQYIVTLVARTRQCSDLSLGASPRASLSLMRLARAAALIDHRDHVRPEDVAALYLPAVAHRVMLSREAVATGKTAEVILKHILDTTPVPLLENGVIR